MTTPDPLAPQKLRVISVWVIRVFLGLVFAAAGIAKLAGVPMMVEIFGQIGLGQWFRYATALVEIVGAIGMFVPGRTLLAALLLSTTMFFAVMTHLLILHTNPIGAIILMVLSLCLAAICRSQDIAGRSSSTG